MNNTKNNFVVGLDIGTSAVRVLVGKTGAYGKLEILGVGSAPSTGVSRGVISNIDKTVQSIRQAVTEAQNQSGIQVVSVNVGVSGHELRCEQHSGSITRDSNRYEIRTKDINKLHLDMHRTVVQAGFTIVKAIPQEYIVDYETGVKDPVGMSGVRIEASFNLVLARQHTVDNIRRCVERAGLRLQKIVPSPIAASLAALTDDEKEAGVVLVDIGGGTTGITVVQDNIVRYLAVLPFGGKIITDDIKHGCTIFQNQAELLKKRYGQALAAEASQYDVVSIAGQHGRPPKEISVKNLAFIIEARTQEIIELIHRHIITSGYEGRLPGGTVLTGGTAQLPGFGQLFEYMTGQETRIGHPVEHLEALENEAIKDPQMATLVGLALSNFELSDNRHSPEDDDEDYSGERQGNGDFLERVTKRMKGWGLMLGGDDDNNDY